MSVLASNRARRRAVAERDGWVCSYCRRALFDPVESGVLSWSEYGPGPRAATLDHYDPSPGRGRNRLENLRLACLSCNSTKGTRMPGPWIEQWRWWLANVGPTPESPTWCTYERAMVAA